MNPTSHGGLRRTCACGRLLCVQVGHTFHIKHRETRFVVGSPVGVVCGRCLRATTISAIAEAKG